MTGIPDGWSSARLGDVCEIVGGATPKTGVAENWGGCIAWVTPDDLSKDRSQIISSGARSLTQRGYDSCSARVFPAGSVIFSSRAPIGYVAIAGAPLCTNQGCKTAVPPDYIDSKYLYHYLKWKTPDIAARASGTTFKEISGKGFAETAFLWPDLDEQRRIVDVLEDHLSRLDAAEGLVARSLASTSNLAHLISENAVADSGPARRLHDLTVGSGYGTSEKCVEDGPGAAVVRIPNLVSGSIDLSDEKRVRDGTADVSRLMLEPGDLLVIRTNGSRDLIGRTAVVQDGVEAAFASYLIRFQLDRALVHPEWVQAVLSTPSGRRTLESLAASSAGQYNLSLSKLGGVLIPVPSLTRQVGLLAALAESLDGLARSRERASGLAQRVGVLRLSLLSAAFTGRLEATAADPARSEELAHV